MARGPAATLFHLCTHKRITLSSLKPLLLTRLHTSSPSQFHSSHNLFCAFSTYLLNECFLPSFFQSGSLSGNRTLQTRLFSAAGDDGNTTAKPNSKPGSDIDKSIVNDGSDDCVWEIVDSSVDGIGNTSRDIVDEIDKKSDEFVHVASLDPAKLHHELKNVEKPTMSNTLEMEVLMEVKKSFTQQIPM